MASTTIPDDALVALADSVLNLARLLDLRGSAAREATALTGAEVTVIRAVHHRPGSTATELSAATALRRSNVSAIAHALEQRGLLQRTEAAGRGVGFVETAEALRIWDGLRAHWISLLRGASADDLRDAVAALAALERLTAAVTR